MLYHELTGPTCSGKSELLKSDLRVSVKPISYTFIIGVIFILLRSPRGFLFLLKHCLASDRSFYHKLRVFANVFAKFTTYLMYSRKNNIVIVDEGVSHIPFILMLKSSDISKFITYFSFVLKRIEIEFMHVDGKTLESRLISRGHKRIRTQKDLIFFVKHHIRIMREYASLLQYYNYNVRLLN